MRHLPSYEQSGHILSNMDARLKILWAAAILGMVLSSRGGAFPALITLCCIAVSMGMRIPVRTLVLRFAEPVFLAVVILLLKLFFSGKDALFSLNVLGVQVTGYRDGLIEGLLIGNRIISAVSIVAVLGLSTPFTEFMAGLSWFRVPKGLVEVMMFAYRYIFVLFEDAMVIYQAQKNRLGYSTIGRGLNSFGTLAGSLTIRAFDNSQNTTIAMVQRGYDGAMPALMHKTFKASELYASAVLLMVMGVLWRM